MNLPRFYKALQQKRKGLTQFLNKLDHIVPEEINTLVAQAEKEVWQEINCTTCANCCKKMTPTYLPKDISRIAKHLNITTQAFKKKWLKQDEDNQDWINTSLPCQFLDTNDKCTIYQVRPADCAEFPHHNKTPFDAYNDTYKANIEYCPATLELISKLKKTIEKEYIW